jgi:glutaredoxin
VTSVTVYTASGCGLCERALEVVREAEADGAVELEVVDIDGDPVLEAAYRELIPVVEIDGERAFTYFVEPESFRARLAGAS